MWDTFEDTENPVNLQSKQALATRFTLEKSIPRKAVRWDTPENVT